VDGGGGRRGVLSAAGNDPSAASARGAGRKERRERARARDAFKTDSSSEKHTRHSPSHTRALVAKNPEPTPTTPASVPDGAPSTDSELRKNTERARDRLRSPRPPPPRVHSRTGWRRRCRRTRAWSWRKRCGVSSRRRVGRTPCTTALSLFPLHRRESARGSALGNAAHAPTHTPRAHTHTPTRTDLHVQVDPRRRPGQGQGEAGDPGHRRGAR